MRHGRRRRRETEARLGRALSVSLERLVATMSGCSTWHSSEHPHGRFYNLRLRAERGEKLQSTCCRGTPRPIL